MISCYLLIIICSIVYVEAFGDCEIYVASEHNLKDMVLEKNTSLCMK